MYKILRAFLFLFGPETAHRLSMGALRMICSVPPLRRLLTKHFKHSVTPTRLLSLDFPNRVGLGAGFDKNAKYLRELEVLGFGFVEIGTVTPQPQAGNPAPRLFRLPKDLALINRMGFNNDGTAVIAERLATWQKENASRPGRMLIGGNIGKNKITENEFAADDYKKCFDALHPFVDYFVVNVSSPNTPGLRELQEATALQKIFSMLQASNKTLATSKPILLKISPDAVPVQLDIILDRLPEFGVAGLVVSNTTISRAGLKTSEDAVKEIGAGGLSGAPLKENSTSLLAYIRRRVPANTVLIGSGGILSAQDAAEKTEAGADLVQLWTGFIYEGPALIKKTVERIG